MAGTKNASYCYDNNGNLTQGDSRTVAWTAFNMPSSVQTLNSGRFFKPKFLAHH